MLYRNKITGGLIETGCSISGGDWEPVPASKKGGSKPKDKGKGKDAAGAGSKPAAEAGEDHWPRQGRTLGEAGEIGETGEDAPAQL